ncbi:MAG: alpha/beta fold hydrolase [Zoogloeaceae bacterium]|jgi:pimeloyl-[acyl-carrier protein] methyl ester esterase|nr:alpha/beta fold hydrolase [Zoogloeaceae bacterium]
MNETNSRDELHLPANLPAFLLPGWGLGRGPLEAVFAGSRWRLLDLPGAAEADANNAAAIPAHFEAAAHAILERLPPRAHLGGWSLGGMLALRCALLAPERIQSLLLIGTTPSFLNRPGWDWGRPPEELAAFRAKVREDYAALLPRFIGSFCRGDRHAGTAQWLRERASPISGAALDAGLGWLEEADLRAAVQAHPPTCPVTLAHGEKDPLMPLAVAHWFREHLPQARLRVFPGRAHAPFVPETPAESLFLRECALP